LTVLGDDYAGDLRLLSRLDTPAVSAALTALDTVAVASFTDSFAVIGVSDPARPSVLSKVRAGFAYSWLRDTFCYVVTDSGFQVYSLANPRSPMLLGSVTGQSWYGPVTVAGNMALTGTLDLSIFDVSDPRNPLWLLDTEWLASCFTAQDTFAYTISNTLDSLRVYSFAGGLHARELGALKLPYHAGWYSGVLTAITVRETLLVAAVPTWLGVYSVAEPAQPRCLYQSRTAFPGYGALLLSHDTLYAALGNRGLFRYRLVTEPSGLELEPIGGFSARPLRVWSSVVNRDLNLAGCKTAILMDASGRKVLDLKAGANDVRALAPGVYFVLEQARAQTPSIRKVVLTE
jgi:hypothetical protein